MTDNHTGCGPDVLVRTSTGWPGFGATPGAYAIQRRVGSETMTSAGVVGANGHTLGLVLGLLVHSDRVQDRIALLDAGVYPLVRVGLLTYRRRDGWMAPVRLFMELEIGRMRDAIQCAMLQT